jgi:CheY-like chemotaxis protein
MFATGIPVLIVDDEPDVLAVSRLAMKNIKVDGLPIKLYTAGSKAEALELFKTTLATQQGIIAISVAFIDVVMETEHAGLELCQYIREELKNKETQLYIRTGQPGIAPERSVIDHYNINGYYTKTEMTEDKLYSLTRSGVRQQLTLVRLRVFMNLLEAMINARSRAGMAGVLSHVITALETNVTGEVHGIAASHVAFIMDNRVVAKHPALKAEEVLARWQAIDQMPGTLLNDRGNKGDKYGVADRHFLLKVAGGPTQAEFGYVCPIPGELPEDFPEQFYGFARSAAALWKNAA